MSFLLPSFADILDIILIASILYTLFFVVRKTTAYEIIGVLSTIFILYSIAIIFNLQMILSVINGLKNYWLLIMIIIFQGEIKNLVSKLSKSATLFSVLKNPVSFSHQAILSVVSIFAEKRTGALIVFEKKQNLDNYISSGEVLDAKLSPKLLLSLFNTSNIMHDGAVIVRNERLYAAKVVLPHSKNEEYARSLGTRHSAAVGITEVSDAFCIVVSEQTGQISFAKDKHITINLSVEELLQYMSDGLKN